jgi:hypothetical protein
MNIETGEVRSIEDITPREMASGLWIKLKKGYTPKSPVSDADRARIIKAEIKRLARIEKSARIAAAAKESA